jgi:hypothetical protein
MIKIKGGLLIITGKDEKFLKAQAKKAKMPPKKILLQVLKFIEEKYTVIDKKILVERI